MYKYIIISLFLILTCTSGAEAYKPFTDLDYKHKRMTIFLSVGFPFATEAQDFYMLYESVFSPTVAEFKVSGLVSGGVKYQFFENFRFGIVSEFSLSTFNDSYTEEFPVMEEVFKRETANSISITNLPIFLTAEVLPENKQFRSYVGIGVGIVVSDILWRQNISTNYEFTTRKGGDHYDKTSVFPAGRIYTGVELGFDGSSKYKYLGSFIMELSYTYMFREAALFSAVKDQYGVVPERIDAKSLLIPGYIGATVAVSINLD